MAAITHVDVAFVSPTGYEVILRGRATEDLDKGDPVVIDAAAPFDPRWDTNYKQAASQTSIDGVVLKSVKANQTVEVLVHGELDGFSGLTPGARLTVVNGAIDSTAPAAGVPPQLFAINASRIYVRV